MNAVDGVSEALDKLLEHVADSNARRGWAPVDLTNAKRDAAANDEAERKAFVAKYDSYWRADVHEAEYLRGVLRGHVTEANIDKFLHSLGLP